MPDLPEWVKLPQRRSARHPQHDYRHGGAYHVVFCTLRRRPILGRLAGMDVELNGLGRLVVSELAALPQAFNGLSVDLSCVMPDHIHVILFLDGLNPERPLLTDVVRRLKSRVTIQFNRWRERAAPELERQLFQRGFYDRFIRNEDELIETRKYIQQNSLAAALEREASAKPAQRADQGPPLRLR